MKNDHEHDGMQAGLSAIRRPSSSGLTALVLAMAALGSASCERNATFLGGSSDSSSGSTESVGQVSQGLELPMNLTNATIRPKKFGRCVEVPSGSTVDATQYQSFECQTDNKQLYDFTYYAPDGSYTIKNKASGKCLWVLDGNDGRWVEQRTCNDQDAHQRWWLHLNGDYEYDLQNVMDPQHYVCMDLADGMNNDGALIQSWSCYPGNSNQRFHITNWVKDFEDQFNSFDTNNWAIQNVVENGEVQSISGANPTVSGGVLSLKMVNNVGDRISSKGKKEFVRGKWVARIRLLSSGTSGMSPAFKLWGASYPTTCLTQPGAEALNVFQHLGNRGADQYSAGAIKGGVSGVSCNINDPDDGTWIDCCNEVDATSLLKSTDASAVALGTWYDYAVEMLGDDLYFTRKDITTGVETFIAHEEVAANYPSPMFAVLGYATSESMSGTWTMEVDSVTHYSGCSGATQYSNTGYSGASDLLPPGDYTVAALAQLGVGNDQMSSLKVPTGCSVTLYSNDNFTGQSLVRTADDSTLVDNTCSGCNAGNNWNDAVSSIKVR